MSKVKLSINYRINNFKPCFRFKYANIYFYRYLFHRHFIDRKSSEALEKNSLYIFLA